MAVLFCTTFFLPFLSPSFFFLYFFAYNFHSPFFFRYAWMLVIHVVFFFVFLSSALFFFFYIFPYNFYFPIHPYVCISLFSFFNLFLFLKSHIDILYSLCLPCILSIFFWLNNNIFLYLFLNNFMLLSLIYTIFVFLFSFEYYYVCCLCIYCEPERYFCPPYRYLFNMWIDLFISLNYLLACGC